MTDDKEILTGTALEDDAAVEPKLRPQTLSEYIGQTKVRENLSRLPRRGARAAASRSTTCS